MEIIEVWQAHGDGGDRAVGPVIAYCSTRSLAEQAAKGRGWYGGNGFVEGRAALRIDGDVWLLAKRTPIDLDAVKRDQDKKLRDETIAGLTAEQRRVLGVAT